jgi:hypothetical protein
MSKRQDSQNVVPAHTSNDQLLPLITYYIQKGLFGNSVSYCDTLLSADSSNFKGQFWKAFSLMRQGMIIFVFKS